MWNVIYLLIAYVLGSIPSALIIGKWFKGIDVRQHGSGNLGATNAFRTLGVKAGSVVLVMDILKGTAGTALGMLAMGTTWHALIFGCAAVLGHVFPLFARFKGGKAVATSAGSILAYSPVLFLVLVISFLLVLYLFKYVSLASMIAGISGSIYSFWIGDWVLIAVTGSLTVFVIIRHWTNIKRIAQKTEPKIKWM
ncbi:glycerol-3-phosphate 1-O-acyltransferase PlsY [Bacillaceae bacterium SIJ1]|uniref:glycerol-3-phosphate 1-O-acyltransferase PlsY n=1 Tax=Litoribacterium kuwaitense TaxID=1398745 RepID=UPI0013EA530D|nr:glycerol-3-phosphate 1-O-acyltransferase PlsY [Litoribacterium kuwaitense]NGP44022.1 glycerol-3-phosphate 1-O-acyltransferase PlsY [Litoribacterium kuwaitense]